MILHFTAYVFDSLFQLIACINGNQKYRKITKVLLMPLLFGAYFFAGGRCVPVMAALALSWVGDILLMRPNEKLFRMTGAGFFVAAHICNFTALVFFEKRLPGTWQAAVFPVLCMVVGYLVYLLIKDVIDKDMRFSSMCYLILLGFMIGICAACALYDKTFRSIAGFFSMFGYLFFMVSDAMLILQWFTVKDPHPETDFKVMLTYCIAQVLIVLGFML